MTKQEFLEYLEKRLQVLNKKERDDILGEYAQHIELKMESGLGEEAAIQDFGDLEELAADILDAYNVNPDYNKKTIQIDGRKIGREVTDCVAKAGHKAGNLWNRCVHGVKSRFKRFIDWFRNLDFKGRAGQPREKRQISILKEMSEGTGRIWGAAGGAVGKIVSLCVKAAVLCVVAPVLLFQLFMVFLFGLLLVLLLLGYPVIGIAIASLGELLCGFAFICGAGTIFFSKKAGDES